MKLKLFSTENKDIKHKLIKILGIKFHFKRKNISINEIKQSYIDNALQKGVKIGKNTELISDICWGTEPYLIEIGENNVISFDVSFLTHDGCINTLNRLYNDNLSKIGKIIIKNNCFIGCRTIILPNVCIGNNVIVGAGSVVTKNIPDNEVWAGNPAKKICNTFDLYKKQKDKNTNREYIELLNYMKEINNEIYR